jgi:hypothetical protein
VKVVTVGWPASGHTTAEGGAPLSAVTLNLKRNLPTYQTGDCSMFRYGTAALAGDTSIV